MPSRTTIWLRRAATMAVLGLAVAIPVTLLVRGDEAAPDGVGRVVAPSVDEEPLRLDRGLRVRYRVPPGWKRVKEDQTLKLRSRDRTMLIAVAAPAPAGRGGQVRRDLLREIRSTYRRVDVRRGDEQRIGGLDARTAVVRARRPRGGQIRILLAVAEGKRRTYVVEVVTVADAEPRRIVQAQTALQALKLRG